MSRLAEVLGAFLYVSPEQLALCLDRMVWSSSYLGVRITYTILGALYYNFGITGPKTLF